jgi:stearoyl-CoA desaturase (delta-9 desaturase)
VVKYYIQKTIAWFDNDLAEQKLEDKSFDFFRAIPFILLHVGCVGVFFVGVSSVALWTAFGLYVSRMFAITGFYHRYFSHKTFKTNRFFQCFFAFLAATSGQRGPLWWASWHRLHHQHADKENDPHSPVRHGFIESHMGWFFRAHAFKTQLSAIQDFAKYPELRWINRFDIVPPLCLAALLILSGYVLQHFFPSMHTNPWQMLVWGFFVSTVLLFHGTCSINSLSHQWGKQDYQTKDHSKNNWFLAIITLGEGWHNNHHFYPATVKQGFKWWQIDITFYVLWVFSKLGIVYSLRLNYPVTESKNE